MREDRIYQYGKALDSRSLQAYLCVGIATARQIGRDAHAEIQIGKRIIYNRDRIDEYIDSITDRVIGKFMEET